MIAEFNPILGCDTQKNFCEGLEKHSAAITRLPPLKEEHPIIQEFRIKAMSYTKAERERKNVSTELVKCTLAAWCV